MNKIAFGNLGLLDIYLNDQILYLKEIIIFNG